MEEEVVGKAYDSHLMRRLLEHVALCLVGGGLSRYLFVNSVLQVVSPLLLKLAIDTYLRQTSEGKQHTAFLFLQIRGWDV